jgi:agmatinase
MTRAMQQALEELGQILQPQGIKVVTTGADEIGQFLLARYGAVEPAAVERRWREILGRIPAARVILLGVPMDIGAGFERGAFKGPLGVRSQLLSRSGLYDRLEQAGILDIGDVRVNPSLLSDDLLHEDTLRAVRRDRWGAAAERGGLPVAPLSILERALHLIRQLNPAARVHLLGGDHSLTWVPIQVLCASGGPPLGVVHFDAHTDLLERRDGIRYSFATWAYHANDAIGRGGRLQQLGTRISSRRREEWEQELSVRQFWSQEILARATGDLLDELVANLRRAGVGRVYITNDIDGTDPRWGAATGTLVQGGMTPDFVRAAIARVGREFPVVGADVTELAPPLKWHVRGEPARSNQLAAGYVAAQLEALTGRPDTLTAAIPIPEPATEAEVLDFPPYATRVSSPDRAAADHE